MEFSIEKGETAIDFAVNNTAARIILNKAANLLIDVFWNISRVILLDFCSIENSTIEISFYKIFIYILY